MPPLPYRPPSPKAEGQSGPIGSALRPGGTHPRRRGPEHSLARIPGTWHAVQRATDLNVDPENHRVSEADLAVVRGIYETWAAGQIAPLLRDERRWRLNRMGEGRERRPDVYVWRDPAGTPRAYVTYQFEQIADSEWDRRLVVADWIALDPEALRALFSFLRNHDSQAKEVHITVPEHIRFRALFDDPRFKVESYAELMLRLVDVAAALQARPYAGAGELTLAVTDPFLEWNTGVYHLAARDGHGTVTFQPGPADTRAAGLSLDQRALAQLFMGYLTPAEAAALGLLTVHDPAALATAGQVFAAPRPTFTDFF